MTPEEARRWAQHEAEEIGTDDLQAAADMYDRLVAGPHEHQWEPVAGGPRLVGDVFQHPHECACGARAWQQRWCGATMFVDIREPARLPT